MCICTKVESKVSTIDINFIGLFEYNFKNDIESIVAFTYKENILIRSSKWKKKAKMKRKQNFCSLLIISNRKSFDYSISSKIKLPDEKFFCFSSSFNRVLNTWKKKTEKERKKRASIEASRNVRSERGPETWRRATNTLAARNAEAGVFVSVVAIFTLHPWHLALFPCPRGGCPSAVGSPCRAFPTHFSFYFSQIHPVLVLPLLVGKIRRESKTRDWFFDILSTNVRTNIELLLFFLFLFSRNVPSNRNLNTFHSTPRCPRTTLISLSLSRDEWTKARI